MLDKLIKLLEKYRNLQYNEQSFIKHHQSKIVEAEAKLFAYKNNADDLEDLINKFKQED